MADNIPEVETAEPEAENTEAQENEEVNSEAEAVEPEENTEIDEEAAKEAEAKEAEKKKAETFKRVSGFFLGVLYILVVLVVLFEAGAVYLWMNFDSFVETQNEQLVEQSTRTMTSSSYSNWTGTYKPVDWPEPVSDFADAPPYGSIVEPQPEPDISAT